MLSHFYTLSQRVLTLALLILGNTLGRMLTSIPGLSPLDVHTLLSSVVIAKNFAHRHRHVSPGGGGGGNITIENRCGSSFNSPPTPRGPTGQSGTGYGLGRAWSSSSCLPSLCFFGKWHGGGNQEVRGGCRSPDLCVWCGVEPRASRDPGRKSHWPGHYKLPTL